MDFVYENQGHITYLSYAISPEDILDTMSLGMITNNKIFGLAPSIFTQMDTTKYIKYNVSAKISMQQFFSGSVAKKNLLGVFKGIISAILAAEDYMIDINSIIFDLAYIFVDVSTCEVSMICLPIQQSSTKIINLNNFFKNIMFSTQFDQSENCDYVAKIINHLNTSTVFSLEDFKVFLESLSRNTVQPSVQNVIPTNEPKSEQPLQKIQPQPQPVAVQTNVSVTSVETAPKVAVSPTALPKPAIPVVPQKTQVVTTKVPAKKKGGFFGLFSSNDKKGAKEKKKAPIQQAPNKITVPPVRTGGGFAIPGQKVPINTPVVNEQQVKKTEKTIPSVSQTQVQVISTPVVPPSQPINFGETTVLGGGNMGETTVLGATVASTVQENPHLIRIKNNEKINLNKPVFRIGKEKSYVDYFIGDNTAISRSHANFISRDGEYFVIDTNSTNHTYVNGTMLRSNVEAKLQHGDKVKLANEDFEFKLY